MRTRTVEIPRASLDTLLNALTSGSVALAMQAERGRIGVERRTRLLGGSPDETCATLAGCCVVDDDYAARLANLRDLIVNVGA